MTCPSVCQMIVSESGMSLTFFYIEKKNKKNKDFKSQGNNSFPDEYPYMRE